MKYRIKKHDYSYRVEYEIQRKSIFGFWHNPDNIDAYTTGFFYTLEEAEKCIERKLAKTKSEVVKTY